MTQHAHGGEEPGAPHRPMAGPALVLTAEELTTLEQAHVQSLDTTSDPQQPAPTVVGDSSGLDQARRSLVARGLLSAQGGLPEGTDLGLLLQTLLDVRLAAQALIVVERLLGEGSRDLRLLHLVPQGGVVEDVHPEGLHGLDLALSEARMVTAVTEMVVPADAQAGTGQITLSMADVAALPQALHHPTVLAELTLVTPGAEEVGHLVALGPRGCWAGPRPRGQEPLRLAPVEPGWVGELVTCWIGDVLEEDVGGEVHGEVHDGMHGEFGGEEGGTMAR